MREYNMPWDSDAIAFDELYERIESAVHASNSAPVDGFCGLSPRQMYRLLYYPFNAPEIVEFPELLEQPPDAPVARLFSGLAAAIGTAGLKPTATGNLPRRVVQELARAELGDEGYAERTRFGDFRSEPDYMELELTRWLA